MDTSTSSSRKHRTQQVPQQAWRFLTQPFSYTPSQYTWIHTNSRKVTAIPEESHEPRQLAGVFHDGEPQSCKKPMLLVPELFLLLDWIHRVCLSAPLLCLNLSQQLKVHCQYKFCSLSKLSGMTQLQDKQDENLMRIWDYLKGQVNFIYI